ncbi:hypothetical protein [Nonomuraea sp. KM90]|uniref:hypothetical protein n=1 Tax=Nonomuraea sp. KM90 TaxID=3457428 RepID=UPI003FCE7DB1
MPSESGYRRRRDPLRPAASSRRQVKWLLRPALTQWRDVGLRGYGFDGLRRSGWRGFNEDRDVAFVDGLYGTGLRLREWSSVLDVELPHSQGRRLHRAWLAEQCIKGAKEGRYYWVPRRALQQVEAYMDPIEGSRAEVVARVQRRGLYERLHGLRIVVGHNARAGALYVEGRDGPVPIALDVLTHDERQLLFRRTPAGLEPLWVWLSINGLPKKPYSWEDTFAAANERVARAWAQTHQVVGGREAEHGWEVRPCPLWATPHMLRHSFALRWFSLLSLVEEQRVEGLSEREAADLREQLGGLWLQLAVLMGHKHPDTTREHYLEPFTGLRGSYLMELLDEDEQAGVDALVRAFAASTGAALDPIQSGAER